jgi:GT2 family glycosyltransferase
LILLDTDYKRGVNRSEATVEELAAMGRQAASFEQRPRISMLLVVSDADEVWIKSTVNSVLAQVYPHVELCVCDNGSERPHIPQLLQDYAASEERIKVRRLPEKRSLAEAYEALVSMASGDFVALIDQGDEIPPEAAFKVVEFLQYVAADVVYTDEDHIDVGGERSDPDFKPYWSPDLLLSTSYTGRLCVIRRSVLETVIGFEKGIEGSEEHDLILRLSERTDRVYHLPEVLYHRRRLPVPSGRDGNRCSTRAVEAALARRGEKAVVVPDPVRDSLRVIRRPSKRARVSVVVLAPEGARGLPLLDQLENSSYPVHQVIVAKVRRETSASDGDVSHQFAARALNLAARRCDGDHLVFLDGRARITTPTWLTELLGHVQRRDVGAVGCELLNPDGSLRHGGSFARMGLLVGDPDVPFFEDQVPPPLVVGTFNFAAATAECMMVRRAVFEEAGGFNDERLPTTFYDLDLSFRLREAGLLNVYTPYASMFSGDPGARTLGDLPNEEEVTYMWKRWWRELVRLLYYRWSPPYTAYQGVEERTLALLFPAGGTTLHRPPDRI